MSRANASTLLFIKLNFQGRPPLPAIPNEATSLRLFSLEVLSLPRHTVSMPFPVSTIVGLVYVLLSRSREDGIATSDLAKVDVVGNQSLPV